MKNDIAKGTLAQNVANDIRDV